MCALLFRHEGQNAVEQIKKEIGPDDIHSGHASTWPNCHSAYTIEATAATNNLKYRPNSLKLAVATETSYTATLILDVTASVPLSVVAHVTVPHSLKLACGNGHCSGTVSLDASLSLNIATQCITCPLAAADPTGGAVPNVKVVATASWLKFNPTAACSCQCNKAVCGSACNDAKSKGVSVLNETKSALLMSIESQMNKYFQNQQGNEQLTMCGCTGTTENLTDPCPPGSHIEGGFQTHASTVLTISNNNTATRLPPIIVPADTSTAVTHFVLGNVCAGGNFYNQANQATATIEESIKSAVGSAVLNEATSYTVPTTFQPFAGFPIFVEYNLANITFQENVSMAGSATAVLYAKLPGGDRITFNDASFADAAQFPLPDQWAAGPGPRLNGVRVSSAVLTGLITLANKLGYFRYGIETTLFDAKLRFNMTFENPTFSVLGEDDVYVNIPSGSVAVTCMNKFNGTDPPNAAFCKDDSPLPPSYQQWRGKVVEPPSGGDPAGTEDAAICFGGMLLFRFTNLTAMTKLSSFNYLFSNKLPEIGFQLNITSFDFNGTNISLVHPRIPLPMTMLKSLLKDVSTKEIPEANNAFAERPLKLDGNLSRLFPPGTKVHVQPQAWSHALGPAPDWAHGYLEAISYDTVGADDAIDLQILERLQTASASEKWFRMLLYADSNECILGGAGSSLLAVQLKPTGGKCVQLNNPNPQIYLSMAYSLQSYENGMAKNLSINSISSDCSQLRFGEIVQQNVYPGKCYMPAWNGSFGSFVMMEDAPIKIEQGMLTGPIATRAPQHTSGATAAVLSWPSAGCTDANVFQTYVYDISSTCTSMGDDTGIFYLLAEKGDFSAQFMCNTSACDDCLIKVPELAPGQCSTQQIHNQALTLAMVIVDSVSIPALPPWEPPPTTTPKHHHHHHRTTPSPHVARESKVIVSIVVPVCLFAVFMAGICFFKKRSGAKSELRGVGGGASNRTSLQAQPARLNICQGCGTDIDSHSMLFCTKCGFRFSNVSHSLNAGDYVDEIEATTTEREQPKYEESDCGARVESIRQWFQACGQSTWNTTTACGNQTMAGLRSFGSWVKSTCISGVRGIAEVYRLLTTKVLHAFVNPPQPEFVRETVLWLNSVCCMVFLTHAWMWHSTRPFNAFSAGAFGKVGLANSDLVANVMYHHMQVWSYCGEVGAMVACLASLSIVLRTFLRPSSWIESSAMILALATLTYFLGLLIPPFLFLFSDGFQVTVGGNSSMIQSDPGILQTLDHGIGTGFATVALTWYSIIFSFVVEGIPVGLYIAAALLKHQRADDSGTVLRIQHGRIKVVVLVAHLMTPMVQLLSAIILFQVTSNTWNFALFWLLLWVIPFVFVNSTSQLADVKIPLSKRRTKLMWSLAGYLLAVISMLVAILNDLKTVFPSFAEIAFISLVMVASSTIVASIGYIALNSEYETDKWLINQLTAGMVVDKVCKNASCTETLNNRSHFCSACGSRHSLCTYGVLGQCPICKKGDTDVTDVALKDTTNQGGGDDIYEDKSTDDDDDSLDGVYEDDVPLLQVEVVDNDPPWVEPFAAAGTRGGTDQHSPIVVAGIALWFFIAEAREQAQPNRYGKRLPFRRLFLMLTVGCVGAFVITKFIAHAKSSPIDELQELLNSISPGLVWPANGTVFDNLFEKYESARDKSDKVAIVAWSSFCLALIIDPALSGTRGLTASRGFCAVGVLLLWVAMVLPAIPNYLRALNYDEIVAFCAPEFNAFVYRLLGNVVDLVCSSFFATTLLMMLLAVCPALVRVSKMMFLDKRVALMGKFKQKPIEHGCSSCRTEFLFPENARLL
jgi:hypothetical protein